MTKPGMTHDRRFEPFDVVVVPFPYADRLAEKRRPALVISNRKLAVHRLVWVAMITSADNDLGRVTFQLRISSGQDCPLRPSSARQRSRVSNRVASTGG